MDIEMEKLMRRLINQLEAIQNVLQVLVMVESGADVNARDELSKINRRQERK